jgi:amino acid adenylation domain-containing protein
MFIKIENLYNLIFNKFKFELVEDGLNVKLPEYINDQDKGSARNFIKENKDFIISVLKNNENFSNILQFELTNNPHPLSSAQERLWFIEKYESGTSAYNIPLVFKVYPHVDIKLLEESLKSIIDRHEVLRTLIKEDLGGNRYQYVIPRDESCLKIENRVVLNRFQLDEAIQQEVHYIYDLSKEGPVRVCSYVLIDESSKIIAETYISIVIHHIAFDGWSIDILLRELQAYYYYYLDESRGVNSSLNLPNLTIQYRDFALWQKSYLSGERLNNLLAYWKNKLNNFETLNLVTDYPRPKYIDYLGADVYFELEESISQQLRKLAKELKVSLYSVLLSGFYLMLRCYSNQQNIVIGTAIANRHYKQIENLIGFFVNSLPLPIKISPAMSVEKFIQEVGSEVVEAQLHQDLPFEKLVEELKISKDSSRHPIFQVMFGVQSYGNSVYGAEESEKSNISPLFEGYLSEKSAYKISRFDLSVSVDDTNTRLRGVFNYATSLYKETTISEFIETYKNILAQFANIHHGKIKQERFTIGDLNYLKDDQYNTFVNKWNQTYRPYDNDKMIQTLFEEQARRTPTNTAIIYENCELNYQGLNERANQLAHYLREQGVGPDVLVAIAIERSLEMIIGLLGILKAGGAYVPLDPNYPKERLQFMLEDTEAAILITETHIQNTLQNGLSDYTGKIIALDDPSQSNILSQYSTANPTIQIFPRHLAYVIYTSGSTGKPKGVMVDHENLIHYLSYCKQTYSLSKGKSLLHSSAAFDMSITSIFLPLVLGNSIHLLSKEAEIDSLGVILNKNSDFSFLKVTPTHLKALQNQITDEFFKNQKGTLVIGGENLLKEDINFWLEAAPATSIFNEYGPTETTVGCCVLKLDHNALRSTASIPIGQPISNIKIYILNEQLKPVPWGAIGEIYIAGDGLTRGYLNRPDLTAERFIANPFINEEEAKQQKNLRLYCTGDLARYLSDGNIEFLGRIDDQVKIRGFRIELGEIEAVLSSHGDVAQTVVLAREDGTIDKNLVAYIVPGEFTPSSTELREFLLEKLPDYMVPQFFVFLDQFPLTLNGKIDRKSLPAPDLNLRQGGEYIAPQTELEQALASIWSEILKIDNIGIYDNFFKLGGHSLLATQVISRIRRAYNIDISLRSLFEQPTIVALSEIVDALKQEKSSLFIPPIVCMERPAHIPLSFAQQRLWFLNQLLPDLALYNIPLALRLRGNLNTNALEKAFNVLIERHESLRTIFPSPEGEANQVIMPKLVINLIEQAADFLLLKELEKKQAIEKLAQEEAAMPFNLSSGPLIRTKLIICSKEEHILLLTMHHIISDGWSLGNFFRELSLLYNAYVKNEEPLLPSLMIQYGDFALWQRKWIQGDILEKQLSYWKEQLAGIPDLLELPTDKPRPKDLSHRAAAYHIYLNKEVKDKLNKLAQDNQASLFMTLLAVFQILLYRYSGQKDIVVGSPIANRHYKETEDLIGFFVNTLAFRTTFIGNENFIEVLNKIKTTTLEAYQHQDIYFDQLVDYLNIPRILNRNPIFQVEFMYTNTKEGELLKLNNIEITPALSDYSLTKFDICFNTYEEANGIGISVVYATDLFVEETIERFTTHFSMLVNSIISDPFQSIHSYGMLTLAEKDLYLKAWNNNDTVFKTDKCISQYFEEQVRKSPNDIAIIYEDQELSYSELNEKANQLAHYLKNMGADSETIVAIAIDKSFDMIIGLLGILKAGSAYVPLDPSYPRERLQFILEDTNAAIILTDSKTIDLLPSTWSRLICLDEEWESIKEFPTTNLEYINLINHLAYIIYTSGSTGKPKGVMINNASFLNHMLWMKKEYNFSKDDIILQRTAYSFDASVWEIFMPLICGSKMIMPASQVSKDLMQLYNVVTKYKVTALQMVPSLLIPLLNITNEMKLPESIRNLFVGGEIFPAETCHILLNKLTATITNLYGPTESTIDATFFKCKNVQDLQQSNTVLIGRPISNIRTYLLDGLFNPVPIGVLGQIYIAGSGLARGYLNRPELTAEKFIPNPFVTEYEANNGDNLRLYCTGDLGRYLPDGNIEFIGRVDEQVKIRGFRIELGEVESTLKTHVDVAQVVVIAREDEPDDKKLVAYVVPQANRISLSASTPILTSSGEKSFSILTGEEVLTFTEDLKNYLLHSLPDYMVPTFFIYLDQIPVTTNGKTDRKILPAPDLNQRNMGNTYIAPRNTLEEELVSIWQEVLKVEKIGVNDNFFTLGGHSLLATQVISRLRHHYGMDIPLRALFDQPTIETLSIEVEQLIKEKMQSLIPPITPQSRTSRIPLSFAQARLWFLDQLLPNSALYNMPQALKLEGKLKIRVLEKAINTLVERHEALRTIFSVTEGEAVQVVIPKLTFDLDALSVDLNSLPEQNKEEMVNKLAMLEANKPFNLSTGPLIRVQLLVLSPEKYVLLITLHHIISDGWSMGIFFRELTVLYDAYAEEVSPLLPALPLQYADFALWQRQWIQGEVLDKQLNYWKGQLAGIPDLLELPTHQQRPKELTYKGAMYHASFSKEIKAKLNQIAQDNHASLFMTLMAAFQVLLYRSSGQKDIVVGSPIANRHYKETEELIGFFVNTLALRTKFVGNESFVEVLNNVKRTTLEAYQHQDTSFEQLVDQLNVNRDLNRNPIFQVMFNFLTAPTKTVLLPNKIKISPISPSLPTAKFDLTLNAYDHEEGIDWGFEYMSEIFELREIERMAQHFTLIIEKLIADPNQSICYFPLLSSKEQHEITQWNATQNRFSNDKCIHELFELQVLNEPNGIALVYQNEQLTYIELNQRANKLARHLSSLGVGPEVLVGVSIDRSFEMIVCLLAILKAGAAYIPLDPFYPEDRLQFMLEDSTAMFLLTQSQFKDKFKSYKGFSIFIDTEQSIIEQELETNLISTISPQNLACLIYTSASSGKPKGVLLSHQLILNRFFWMWEKYPFTKDEVCCQKTSLNFVDAIWEIFGPMLKGIQLVLIPPLAVNDPRELIKLLKDNSISRLVLVPALLQTLLDEPSPLLASDLKSLRLCVVSGEALPLTTSLAFQKTLLNNTVLLNLYGSTEIGADATCFELNKEMRLEQWACRVSIGKPISNMQIYILDMSLNRVPVGLIGEIYVGGEGLARGYFNRPDLTAERFIANPFIQQNEQDKNAALRLFRTGDLARYLPDGNIEFLGRADEQIKIRGFRIELGEIESIIKTHRDIAQTIVIAKGEDAREKKIIAYVVPQKNILSQLSCDSTLDASSGQSFSLLKGEILEGVTESLRNHILRSLPDYMMPSSFVYLDQLPLNPNGKLDRKSLPVPMLMSSKRQVVLRNESEEKLCRIWGELLNIQEDVIGLEDNFFDMGGNSILTIKLRGNIEKEFGIENVPISNFFKYPTIKAFNYYFLENKKEKESKSYFSASHVPSNASQFSQEIAVIALSGMFPNANDTEEFWNNIANGKECLEALSIEACKEIGVPEVIADNENYIPIGGSIKDIDKFDPSFWKLSPNDAAAMDPQLRKFLEHTWIALEKSGYIRERQEKRIGVFAGMSDSKYYETRIHNNEDFSSQTLNEDIQFNGKDFFATKISYLLGLTGTSLNINTACSTSLVAIVEACKDLTLKNCDMAVAGGISLQLPEYHGYIYYPEMIFSKDGHCRTFDQNATGTVFSAGIGVVILKRLENAIKDNDNIIAIIKGYATNNDGHRKVGYAAPSVLGQTECILEAQNRANVGSDTIDYVECHGTGTSLGDPIEVMALQDAFNKNLKRNNYDCILGAVKANIGHANSAAGIAGFIKVCKMLQTKTIPPQINFDVPNLNLDLKNTNFKIVTKRQEWEKNSQHPRRAGVSAFGIGGTNAHIILEEYVSHKEPIKQEALSQFCILPISAKSESSYKEYVQVLRDYIESNSQINLSDIAYTLQYKREYFPIRGTIVVKNKEDALKQLKEIGTSVQIQNINPDIVFMFSGQGSQYSRMAENLYKTEHEFRTNVDKCCKIISELSHVNFKDYLYPELKRESQDYLIETKWAQPALFTICYSLAKLLESLDIKASAYIGHSIGEYVAATLSGVLSLEDALKIIIKRAEVMQKMSKGSMLAVNLATAKIIEILPVNLEISVYNAPEYQVVSGEEQAIDLFKIQLDKLGISCTKLHTSHAFHSRFMHAAAEEFEECIKSMKFNKPNRPFISNVSGDFIFDEDAVSASYWASHIRMPVQFSKGIETLTKNYKNAIYLEVGPGNSLCNFVSQHKNNNDGLLKNISVLPNAKDFVRNELDDAKLFYSAVGKLWNHGYAIDWSKVTKIDKNTLNVIDLPTYQFEKNKCWIDLPLPKQIDELQIKKEAEWIYQLTWKRLSKIIPPQIKFKKAEVWLIFRDKIGKVNPLIDYLNNHEQTVITVDYTLSNEDISIHDRHVVINLYNEDHYSELANYLEKCNLNPSYLIHAWTVTDVDVELPNELGQYLGFYSLVLLQDKLFQKIKDSLNLYMITNGVNQVTGQDVIHVNKGTILGAIRAIPQEAKNIKAYLIDIGFDNFATNDSLISIMAQNFNYITESNLSIRFGSIWKEHLESAHAPYRIEASIIKDNDSILITGGLGGIGLAIAKEISRHHRVKLLLINRRDINPAEDSNYNLSQWNAINSIKENGCEIELYRCDISNSSELNKLLTTINQKHKRLDGVIHAAGAPPLGLFERNIQSIKQAISAKTVGTENLFLALKNQSLKFFVMASSLASLIGDGWRIEYCAANSYLDVFSGVDAGNITHLMSINWLRWLEVGMGLTSSNDKLELSKRSNFQENKTLALLGENNVTENEGAKIFYDLINQKTINQAIVSKLDIHKMKELLSKNSFDTEIAVDVDKIKNVLMEDDSSELENKIALIFCQILGSERLSKYDSYFELGGNSLSAIKMINKLNKEFNVNINLSLIFTENTVDKLARFVKSCLDKNHEASLALIDEGEL